MEINNIEELFRAYTFGKQLISDYQEAGKQVPEAYYQRQLEITDNIILALTQK